jgi:hypothetical protein
VHIGGGTIDGAIFRLNRAAGFPRLAIPSAAVRPLGTVAVAHDLVRRAGIALSDEQRLSLSQQVDLMLFDAKQLSSDAKTKVAAVFAGYDKTMRNEVQNFVRRFVNDARMKQSANGHTFTDAISGKKIQLRMFLAGGGAKSPWYRSVIQHLDPEENSAFDGIKAVRLETVARPSGHRGEDYSRFVIALGLANSPEELEEASQFLPSRIPRKPPPPRRQANPMITKDDV